MDIQPPWRLKDGRLLHTNFEKCLHCSGEASCHDDLIGMDVVWGLRCKVQSTGVGVCVQRVCVCLYMYHPYKKQCPHKEAIPIQGSNAHTRNQCPYKEACSRASHTPGFHFIQELINGFNDWTLWPEGGVRMRALSMEGGGGRGMMSQEVFILCPCIL